MKMKMGLAGSLTDLIEAMARDAWFEGTKIAVGVRDLGAFVNALNLPGPMGGI